MLEITSTRAVRDAIETAHAERGVALRAGVAALMRMLTRRPPRGVCPAPAEPVQPRLALPIAARPAPPAISAAATNRPHPPCAIPAPIRTSVESSGAA